MEAGKERCKPTAAFMAFGTKGDVYPIAAIAAAFASDQRRYNVVFITHSAFRNLAAHLSTKNVECALISSPPVLSLAENDRIKGYQALSFSVQKQIIIREHRQECFSVMERIYGAGPNVEGNFVVINFFALEGWNLAELFQVRCVVAAPYIVPYSAPSSFERQFRCEFPLLFKYLEEAPVETVSWNDVIHWMWPLFSEDWGSWRSNELNLSRLPFTDPVTGLPMWHYRLPSPLLLYGFSREVVECPDYWPSNARICGFWFLPPAWQFSCNSYKEIFDPVSCDSQEGKDQACSIHSGFRSFLKISESMPLVFVGLSSIGSMGFLKNPRAFLHILQAILEVTRYRFILFSAGYEPLESAAQAIAVEEYQSSDQQETSEDGIFLFSRRLFCFSGSVPYTWLFRRCAAVIHHGGSGSTAAALHAGIPQVLCPFMHDQFYWAERMFWLGVAPEPVKRSLLLPAQIDDTSIREGASMLSHALDYALSSQIRSRAQEISERISHEDFHTRKKIGGGHESGGLDYLDAPVLQAGFVSKDSILQWYHRLGSFPDKLSARSTKCIFLGYSRTQKVPNFLFTIFFNFAADSCPFRVLSHCFIRLSCTSDSLFEGLHSSS
ncbi:hypothetical protein Ancab_002821 [Ancistrocladus abbreviatus]